MALYLAKVRDVAGAERTVKVEAETLAGVRTKLEASGHTEVLILTGEVEAESQALLTDDERRVQAKLSPERAARYRQGKSSIADALLRNWFVLPLLIGSLVWLAESPGLWSVTSALVTLSLLSMVIVPMRLFPVLLQARQWGRWRSVHVLAWIIRPLTVLTTGDLVRSELEFSRAMAHAGLGDLSRGLRLVEHWHEKMSPSLYWGRLANVFGAARRYDDVLACVERGVEESKGGVEPALDLALQLVQFRFDRERVRQLLSQVEGQDMGEVLVAAASLCRAALLIDEQRAVEAVDALKSARATSLKYGVATAGLTALIDLHLALALRATANAEWQAAADRALPLLLAAQHPLAERLMAASG